MEALIQELINQQRQTNELLMYGYQGKDPNELLTAEQIHEEFGIGLPMVRRMLKDPQMDAMRYTSPFKVTRQAFYDYINKKHDYLRKDG